MFSLPHEQNQTPALAKQIADLHASMDATFASFAQQMKVITEDMDALEASLAEKVHNAVDTAVAGQLPLHVAQSFHLAVSTAKQASDFANNLQGSVQALATEVSHLKAYKRKYETLARLTFIACGAAIAAFLTLTVEVVYRPTLSNQSTQEQK